MSIRLTPETETLIQEKVDSGRYATAEEVIEAAIRLLDEQERRLRWLRAELAIGEEQERRGELIELTAERFEAIKRQARENARAGKPIKDAVKPSVDPHRRGVGRGAGRHLPRVDQNQVRQSGAPTRPRRRRPRPGDLARGGRTAWS